jgi:hypothetical protein
MRGKCFFSQINKLFPGPSFKQYHPFYPLIKNNEEIDVKVEGILVFVMKNLISGSRGFLFFVITSMISINFQAELTGWLERLVRRDNEMAIPTKNQYIYQSHLCLS